MVQHLPPPKFDIDTQKSSYVKGDFPKHHVWYLCWIPVQSSVDDFMVKAGHWNIMITMLRGVPSWSQTIDSSFVESFCRLNVKWFSPTFNDFFIEVYHGSVFWGKRSCHLISSYFLRSLRVFLFIATVVWEDVLDASYLILSISPWKHHQLEGLPLRLVTPTMQVYQASLGCKVGSKGCWKWREFSINDYTEGKSELLLGCFRFVICSMYTCIICFQVYDLIEYNMIW